MTVSLLGWVLKVVGWLAVLGGVTLLVLQRYFFVILHEPPETVLLFASAPIGLGIGLLVLSSRLRDSRSPLPRWARYLLAAVAVIALVKLASLVRVEGLRSEMVLGPRGGFGYWALSQALLVAAGFLAVPDAWERTSAARRMLLLTHGLPALLVLLVSGVEAAGTYIVGLTSVVAGLEPLAAFWLGTVLARSFPYPRLR